MIYPPRGTIRGVAILALVPALLLVLVAGCVEGDSAGAPGRDRSSEEAELPEPVSVSLHEVRRYGASESPTQAVLGDPRLIRFALGKDRAVYVLDGQASRVVKFSEDGQVAWRVGEAGEGPAQLDGPLGIAVGADDDIYILHRAGTRLDVWGRDGDYKERISISVSPRPHGVVGFIDDQIVLWARIPGGIGVSVLVGSVSSERLVESTAAFEVRTADLRGVTPPAPVPVSIHGKLIAVGSNADYRIRLFDTSGNIVRSIVRRVNYPARPGYFTDGPISGRRDHGFVGPSFDLGGDGSLVVARWLGAVKDPDAEALDWWRSQGPQGPSIDPAAWSFQLDFFDTTGLYVGSFDDVGPLSDMGSGAWREIYPADWGMPLQVSLAADDTSRSFEESCSGSGPHVIAYTLAEHPFPSIRQVRMCVRIPY